MQVISGAVAGKMRFAGYFFLTLVMSGFVLPISRYWAAEDKAWLFSRGFYDTQAAASNLLMGGFAGLTAAILLGPRKGVFTRNGTYVMLNGNISHSIFGILITYW